MQTKRLPIIFQGEVHIERTWRACPRARLWRSEGGCGRGNRAAADATAELKKMSMDELKEKGERYQQLLEERALADVLYS